MKVAEFIKDLQRTTQTDDIEFYDIDTDNEAMFDSFGIDLAKPTLVIAYCKFKTDPTGSPDSTL